MKKEYLILIVIIIFASSYLLLHKENQNNYTLPKIEKIDTSKVTGIIIKRELDEKKGVHVKLLENSNTVFELTIGKLAPSYNHTFVMIANDKNIYHASGSFRGDFNKTVDEFKKKEEPKDKPEDNPKEAKNKKEN